MAVFTGLGSAASPSITFSADTNTGIFSPGADQVAVATNGSGRLFINSTGLVGVGTANPSANGLVTIAETTNARLYLTDSTLGNTFGGQLRGFGVGGQGGHVELGVVDNNVYTKAITVGAQASDIIFSKGALERMRINPAGRVGIGTSGPGSALEINAAAATSPFIAKINTAEAARIDSSGRLLVGTSTGAGAGVLQSVSSNSGRFQSFAFTRMGLGQNPANANIFKVRMPKLSDGLSATLTLNVLANAHENIDVGAQASATYCITLLRVGGWGGTIANTQIQANVAQIGSTITQGFGVYTLTGLSVTVDVGASSLVTEDATIRVSWTATPGASAAYCRMSGTCSSTFNHALEIFVA